ncbi:MAG: hypothetical protein LBP34_05165 [Flavobacteriaceae bacterium]|jgi:hypothetical protein|nr:hypothetical protein [Flavobacteriaceae bacterium]
MIKGDFLDNIIAIFQENERFEHVDFKIDINHGTVRIVYLVEPEYHITFQDKNHFKEKDENAEYDISGEAIPGEFSLHEHFTLTRKTDVYAKVKSWLDIIWKEISLTSPLGLLEKEQEQIDQICEKFDSYEDHFTTEEILKIKVELNALEKILEQEILDLVGDTEIQKKELEKLHSHFKMLEQILPSLKKKGWIRCLTGRVLHNVKRILKLRQKLILNNSNPHKNT